MEGSHSSTISRMKPLVIILVASTDPVSDHGGVLTSDTVGGVGVGGSRSSALSRM